MSANTGGPAFPAPEIGVQLHDQNGNVAGYRVLQPSQGMTLLDWYAGQALPWCLSEFAGNAEDGTQYAEAAYQIASAMLAEKARREATGNDSLQVPDHSPDAGKMVELQAANRELVEALEGCLENLARWSPVKHREARATLTKHKGAA